MVPWEVEMLYNPLNSMTAQIKGKNAYFFKSRWICFACLLLLNARACALVILKQCSANECVPGQEDALHHGEVLHENISVWLGAQVSHSVADAQLNGSFECGCCRLPNTAQLDFRGTHVVQSKRTSCKLQLQNEALKCQKLQFLYWPLGAGAYAKMSNLAEVKGIFVA